MTYPDFETTAEYAQHGWAGYLPARAAAYGVHWHTLSEQEIPVTGNKADAKNVMAGYTITVDDDGYCWQIFQAGTVQNEGELPQPSLLYQRIDYDCWGRATMIMSSDGAGRCADVKNIDVPIQTPLNLPLLEKILAKTDTNNHCKFQFVYAAELFQVLKPFLFDKTIRETMPETVHEWYAGVEKKSEAGTVNHLQATLVEMLPPAYRDYKRDGEWHPRLGGGHKPELCNEIQAMETFRANLFTREMTENYMMKTYGPKKNLIGLSTGVKDKNLYTQYLQLQHFVPTLELR
jgi:hypothetical protein